MNRSDPPRSRWSRPQSGNWEPWEPRTQATAKRILLVSRNTRLLQVLTRQLSALGHRVWTIRSEEDGPATWSPHLYDVLVFSTEGGPGPSNGMCRAAKNADSKLFLVILAREPQAMDCASPDAVITETEEPAIAEKLLAVVNGSMGEAA